MIVPPSGQVLPNMSFVHRVSPYTLMYQVIQMYKSRSCSQNYGFILETKEISRYRFVT